MDTDKIAVFADVLRQGNAVFFGGAGVSTESGLRDYRSADGIYTSVSKYGKPPEEILSHDFFFADTALFYAFYRDFFMGEPQPNAAHKALAELEEPGLLRSVITQNIDGLHQKAGSKKVWELHGTTNSYHCIQCGKSYGRQALETGTGIPHCACGGVLKPDVVLYGEMLPEETVDGALLDISAADTLIIGGTSLAVYPAAGFIRYFRGKNLVVINKQPTDADSRADLVFRDRIGQLMSQVMRIL